MPKGNLTQSDREFQLRLELGKGLLLLANLAAGSLLFGQAVSGIPFKLRVTVLVVLLVAWLYSLAIWVMKGVENRIADWSY